MLPKCEKDAVIRGLCRPCYNAVSRIVSKNKGRPDGLFSWEHFIEKGYATKTNSERIKELNENFDDNLRGKQNEMFKS